MDSNVDESGRAKLANDVCSPKYAHLQGVPRTTMEHEVLKDLDLAIWGDISKFLPTILFDEASLMKIREVLVRRFSFSIGDRQDEGAAGLQDLEGSGKCAFYRRGHMLEDIRRYENVLAVFQ